MLFGNKTKTDNRKAAMLYLANAMAECGTTVDLGIVLGAAGLAENLGLIDHNEYLVYHQEAYRLHKIFEDERKEKYRIQAEAKKAERAAKAKEAKQKV